MQIEKVTNLEEYNTLIKCSVSGHFMQSTYWSELKSRFGWGMVGHYLIKDGNRVVGCFTILKKSKFGITILYVPRGPIWFDEREEIITFALDSLKQIAKKEGAFFIRVSPMFYENNEKIKNILKSSGFGFSKKQLQTKATILVDLKRPEEEILKSFHEKTRYNIRLAGKKGVQVKKLESEKELLEFYEVMRKMSERQDYDLQSYNYYEHIWKSLQDIARIYLAIAEGKVIGGVVVFSYAGRSYYMYGGFDYEYRNLMGNYLVHWEIMREAKARGDEYYDLQGVPLIKDENHPMYGFYRFKKGFNGQEVEFIGEYDYSPVKFLYNIWNNYKLGKGVYLQ